MKFYAVKVGRETGIFESWDACSKRVHGYPGAIYKSFKTYSEASEYLGDAAEKKSFLENLSKEKSVEDEFQKNCSRKNVSQMDASREEEPSGEDAAEDVIAEDELPDDEEEKMKRPPRKKREIPENRDYIETGRMDGYVLTESAKAYVDGSYLASTGEFSYGCILLFGDAEIRFYEKMADEELSAMRNVAGEIKGAEAAMRFAVANGISELTIYHDYEGIARWCTGDWTATKPGTIAYSNFYQSLPKGLRVRFVKVQGHSGDTYNELADRLAKFALGIGRISI